MSSDLPPLPTVSTFSHQVDQCINDIGRCLTSCADIRRKRNLGRDHYHHKTTALDDLENSLRAGSSFISGAASRYPRLYRSDPDGIDDDGGTEFAGFISQIEDVNVALQSIAEPSHHHHHRYRHHHLSHWFASGWDYDAHHSHEHPHFHELRLQWERIRDNIPRTFADMDARLALKERIKAQKKEQEDKLKKAKKELDDIKKEDKRELEEIKKDDKEELEEVKKENKKELKKLHEHNEERLLEKEKMDHKRELAVEHLLEKKIEEDDDPIEKMDKLAHVMGHLSRAITPRTSHEHIHNVPIRLSLNSNVQAAGYGTGSEVHCGHGPRVEPVIIYDHHQDRSHSHIHPRHHHRHHPVRLSHSCPDLSDSESSFSIASSRRAQRPLLIETNINNNTHADDESLDEEQEIIIDRRGIVPHRYQHQDDRRGYRHGHRYGHYIEPSRYQAGEYITLPTSQLAELVGYRRRRRSRSGSRF